MCGYLPWHGHVLPGTAVIKIICVHRLYHQGLTARPILDHPHIPQVPSPRNTLYAADMVHLQHLNRSIPFYMLLLDTRRSDERDDEGGLGPISCGRVGGGGYGRVLCLPKAFTETDARAAFLLLLFTVVVCAAVLPVTPGNQI